MIAVRTVYFSIMLFWVLAVASVIGASALAQRQPVPATQSAYVLGQLASAQDKIEAINRQINELHVSLVVLDTRLGQVQETLKQVGTLMYLLVPAIVAWLLKELWALRNMQAAQKGDR